MAGRGGVTGRGKRVEKTEPMSNLAYLPHRFRRLLLEPEPPVPVTGPKKHTKKHTITGERREGWEGVCWDGDATSTPTQL